MKKLLLLAGLAIGLNATAGSGPDNPASLTARANALTRVMAEKAQLDEGQFLKVKNLNLRMLTELEDINTRFSADPEIRDVRLADAQTSYYRELAHLLRPSQLVAYTRSQSSMTALGIPAR
ncbi:hypothetical protein [Hymenobacter sp. B81]|uniref:hypothetical protein n=1 Tax=Hymenobacter sp. B81 TaxID=3344878 RepID=UPI0037DCC16E